MVDNFIHWGKNTWTLYTKNDLSKEALTEERLKKLIDDVNNNRKQAREDLFVFCYRIVLDAAKNYRVQSDASRGLEFDDAVQIGMEALITMDLSKFKDCNVHSFYGYVRSCIYHTIAAKMNKLQGFKNSYEAKIFKEVDDIKRMCDINGIKFDEYTIVEKLGVTENKAYEYLKNYNDRSVGVVFLDESCPKSEEYDWYDTVDNKGINIEKDFFSSEEKKCIKEAKKILSSDEKKALEMYSLCMSCKKVCAELKLLSGKDRKKSELNYRLSSIRDRYEEIAEIMSKPEQMVEYFRLLAARKMQAHMYGQNTNKKEENVVENSPTWILMEAVNKYLKKITGEGNVAKYIDTKDKDELKKLLISQIDEAPTLGDYIYPYVYVMLNMDIEYKEDDIRTKIRQALNESGMEKSDNGLSGLVRTQTIMDNLKKKAICCTRKDIFSLALGLNIPLEDVSVLLTKVIMDSDFNFKDFREVIYYWVLSTETEKRGIGISRYKLVCNYIDRYLCGEFANSKYGGYLWVRADEQTRILGEHFKKLSSEEQFASYLHSIYKSIVYTRENRHTKDIYMEFVRMLPKVEESNSGKQLARNISYYRSLATSNYNDVMESIGETLLPKKYLDIIFSYALGSTKDFTGDIIKNRENNHQSEKEASTPTRREILALMFLFHSSKFITCDDERSRKSTIYAFKQDLNMVMEERGMYSDLYLRNMFDFFIQICWLHQNPYAYFCASWKEALRKE